MSYNKIKSPNIKVCKICKGRVHGAANTIDDGVCSRECRRWIYMCEQLKEAIKESLENDR